MLYLFHLEKPQITIRPNKSKKGHNDIKYIYTHRYMHAYIHTNKNEYKTKHITYSKYQIIRSIDPIFA